MLEGCKSFKECEEILSEKMGQIRYIAQVELSKKDMDILESLIDESIKKVGPEQTKNRLKYFFPFCTAFFMVYKGIWEYYSGNYWSCLSPLPDISNPNSQSRWGEWFLKFLKANKLAEFNEIERTYRYVTPILIHGGIPQVCIEDFFEKIIKPLVEQGYNDREEIADFLYSYRIRQKEILKTENLIYRLKNQLFQLEQEKACAEKLVKCFNRLKGNSKIVNIAEYKDKKLSSIDIRSFYEEKRRELRVLKNELESLEAKNKRVDKSIAYLDEIKGKCFEAINIISRSNLYLSYIEKAKREISKLGNQRETWCVCSNVSTSLRYHLNRKRLRRLYLSHMLEEQSRKLKEYAFKLKGVINHILSIYSILVKEFGFSFEYKDSVYEAAASLENPGIITEEIFETISSALENICICQDEIRNKAEESKNMIQNEIRLKKELLGELNSDIDKLENLCRCLGNGYFDRGLERISEWISDQGEIRKEKDLKIFSLKQELNKYQNNIKRLSCFAQYAEKTVQHFLLYGKDWAEQWLAAGVELVLNAAEGKTSSNFEIHYPDVPSRFVSAFWKWWEKQIDTDPDKALKYPSAKTGQHFTTPLLSLDPVFGELKIIVGKQRIFIPENIASLNLFIRIEDKNQPDKSVCIPLKCYRTNEKNLVETKEIEHEIQYISSNYIIVLGQGNDIYKTWEIPGIDTNIPFTAFNLKGIHIPGNVCPKGQAWILIKDEYEFKDNIPVLEEIISPALFEGYRLILADFTNVGSFSIGKKDGTEAGFTLGKVESEAVEPYLLDAPYIPGLKISGALVYNEHLPELAVPADDEGRLEGWSMVIRKGKRLRKYIRLSELDNENVYRDKEYLIINLRQFFDSMGDLTGFYSIYLRNPMGEEINFEFAYIPDLFVGFEKDSKIHFPSDNMNRAELTMIFSPGISFTAELPAVITDVADEAYDIEIPWTEDQLTGKIVFDNGEKFNLELELPNIKWRIQGLDHINSCWNIEDKEIWIDDEQGFDNLSLHVSVPQLFEDKAYYYEVGIYGCNHYIAGKFTNGRASVNLAQFSDTIGGNSKTYSFYIKIYGIRFNLLGEGILFNLRKHWEVKNLQWESKIQDDKIKLKIYWEDVGKAANRVIQLWKCWRPWESPFKYNIPDGDNFINIQEDKTCLEDGRYLVKFDTEGAWDEPVLSDFPSTEENTHFVEINSGAPRIQKLEFLQDSYGSIKIYGSIYGAGEGIKIECFIIGLVRGKPLVFKKSTELMDDGFFSITVPGKVMVKKWAHWLVIKGEDIPFYHISIVPNPSPIEIKVFRDSDINIISSDMVKYIKIITGGKREQKSYKFSGTMARNILNISTGKKEEMELKTNGYGKKQKLKLIWENSQYFLMIENGVKCTSCGALVESQGVWNLEHYPRCKSFIYNYTNKIKVDVVVGIDSRSDVKLLQETYKAADLDLLELCSNIHSPEPEWQNGANFPAKNREELQNQIFTLIKQEMDLFKIAVRGEE